jgi:hypothetical protein
MTWTLGFLVLFLKKVKKASLKRGTPEAKHIEKNSSLGIQ